MPTRLFTPGPTPVPPEIALAMAAPLPHHRTPEFQQALGRAAAMLQQIHRTTDPVLVLTASGTGAMEAAVVNLTQPGERVLAVDAGKFGARWCELLGAYGRDLSVLRLPWGESPDADEVRRAALERGARALFVTHSETSTGALADVEALAAVARELDALLVVDAVTSLGAHRLETATWGIDCVVSGSQKGYMLPPGLAFASLSGRARARLASNPTPRYYFDFGRALKTAPQGQTPWTPAISLVLGLEAACRRLLDEGMERVWHRHQALADAVRSGVRALGLHLVARHPSNAVTAVHVPQSVGADAVRETMWKLYGIKLAGGQDDLKGKILRIGHLGAYDAADVVLVLGALEEALRRHGHVGPPAGAALAAAAPSLARLDGGAAPEPEPPATGSDGIGSRRVGP
jgi:aspartate aminotransferase-like enzyme